VNIASAGGSAAGTGRNSAASSLLGVWALFLAFLFLQVGTGLQRILLPMRAESEGFSAGSMGMVMAVHFAGYLLGAKGITRALASVGHIRVFAALASTASAAVLVNAVLVLPASWAAVYFVGGVCNAGVLVILESWLNDRATNETRGSILGAYMMIMMGGTAIGQLRVAIESVYSVKHNPICDSLCLHAISMIVKNLPECPKLDVECLLNTKTAAAMASLGSVGGGINTATAHHVGGIFDVPHGDANAIMLPHSMRFNAEASADRQALIAQAMGIDTSAMSDYDAALAAADAVEDLRDSLGLPNRLRDVGVPEEGLELIASATLQDRSLATNPTPVTDAGPIMSVLRSSW